MGRLVDEVDPVLVAAAVEGGVEPDADNFESSFEGHHALAEGEDVGIVVLAGEPS